MWDRMEDAHARMGKLLTSLQRHRRHRKDRDGIHTSVLVVLDDVASQSDLRWFQFRWNGGEQVNDLLVTSGLQDMGSNGGDNDGVQIVNVPPLEMKEALRLLLTEADLPGNHPLGNNRAARALVRDRCALHPMTIKFAGRWLGLKRATSGGQKGIDEIVKEISEAIEGCLDGNDQSHDEMDVLYSLLNQAMSPLVKGNQTKIVRLCFAALVKVFYEKATSRYISSDSSASLAIPLEMATDFFLKVVEGKHEREILAKEDSFFQSNGRQASRLVPEILGALGIFNITRHTTQIEGSETNESSIQIDHDLVRSFCKAVMYEEEGMHSLVKSDSGKRWNEAFVMSYLHRRALGLWDDLQPDRSRRYALEHMPVHMIRAGMFEDAEALLHDASFVRGRFWSLGWTDGTRVHVDDAEALCLAQGNDDDNSSKLVAVCKRLEAVLMEEVARESGGPKGGCSTLEAGRCLHEISLAFARRRLWDEAARFCDTSRELAESNLGPSSELVAGLLYNSAVMHVGMNAYEKAERRIGDCLDVRVKISGTENILYVRALCLLGDILSSLSDYSAAESCFNKCIGILKVMPARHHLDYGIALYKLGRNQHRRGGYLDEALRCYEDAIEFEKGELHNHTILIHMGDLLLDRVDPRQAKHTFKEALDSLCEVEMDDSSSFELKINFAIAEGRLLSIEGKSDECVQKYLIALTLLQQHTPEKKRKMAHVNSMIGAEHEKKGKFRLAEKFYEKSVGILKMAFGPTHLDIAESLVNLSGVKSALGVEEKNSDLHNEATDCLEESLEIQKSRLGNSIEVATTLTIYGAHLKTIGSYGKAESAYEDALKIIESVEGDQDLPLASALQGMADLMAAMSNYDEAIGKYKHCLGIQMSALGTNHSSVGDTYELLGFAEVKNGDLDAALSSLERALAVRKTVGDKAKIADTLNNIGNLRRERKEFELALQQYTECMDIRISNFGRNHESVVDILMAKGNVQSDMDNPHQALMGYREALQILESIKGPGDPSVATLLQKAGMVQFRAGYIESGRSFLKEAVEIYRQGGEAYESQLITPLFVIGNIHSILKQEGEAQRAWTDAFEMSEKVGGRTNSQVHQVLMQLVQSR
ncbi:hypothetical protein ACHAWF_012861 [Thalassiosira exigua]